jgi:ribosomal-protein-alanine N-acetyltransferase
MIEIIPMTKEHINEVSELEAICFYTAWSKEDFIKEITENKLAIYYVAILNGTVIGYCGMWHIVDEGHITNIAVLPENRRTGVGTKLVQKLIDSAIEQGIVGLTLEVRIGNLSAQKLYTRFGFKPEGIRKRYYSDTGEDAVIMWKHF